MAETVTKPALPGTEPEAEKAERRPFHERAIDQLARMETGCLREAARVSGDARSRLMTAMHYLDMAKQLLTPVPTFEASFSEAREVLSSRLGHVDQSQPPLRAYTHTQRG